MHRYYWRTLAGLLAVAVGSVVVWAEDSKPSLHKPCMPPGAPGLVPTTPCPCAHGGQQAPLPRPVVTETHQTSEFVGPPAPISVGRVALAPPVCDVPPPAPVPEAPTIPPPAPVPTAPVSAAPPAPPIDVVPPPAPVPPPVVEPSKEIVIQVKAPPKPMPVVEPLPAVAPVPPVPPLPAPAPTPMPAPLVAPAPVPPPAPLPAPAPMPTPAPLTPVAVKPASVAIYKLSVRMGSEQPKFEIRCGDEIVLKGTCDKLDLNSPANGPQSMMGLKAAGKIKFSGPNLEGTCDSLQVLTADGEVTLTGHVLMRCKKGKLWSKVEADKLSFHLAGEAPTGVTPASHQQP